MNMTMSALVHDTRLYQEAELDVSIQSGRHAFTFMQRFPFVLIGSDIP